MKWWKTFKQEWMEYKWVCDVVDGRRPWFMFLRFCYYFVRDELRHLWCLKFGHDWEDDSWCGPDSGTMGCVCRRCGESHYTTLY